MALTKNRPTSNSGNTKSDIAGLMMLLGCSATLFGHLYLLKLTDSGWIATPLSALSQSGQAWQHAAVLAIFGLSQSLLAVRVQYRNAGTLTRCVQLLSLINALLIGSLGHVFLLPDHALHTSMLMIIASLTGLMMACLFVRRVAIENQQYAKLVHGVFLLLWLLAIPVFFFIDSDMIGAYQRTVGGIYLLWLSTLALLFKITDLPSQRCCNAHASLN